MSCKGIGAEFGKLADKVDELQDTFDAAVDKAVDKITGALGITALEAKMAAEYGIIQSALQGEFPSLDSIFQKLKENGLPFADDIGTIIKLANQGQNFANHVESLKAKYGDSDDIVNGILDAPAGFVRDFGADLENLCDLFPNIQKAKDGDLKIVDNKGSLDGIIDLVEIKREGFSPTIKRLKDALKNLELVDAVDNSSSKINEFVDSVYSK